MFIYEVSPIKTVKPIKTESIIELEGHYRRVKEMRVNGLRDDNFLTELFTILKSKYPKEWLLYLEVLEIATDLNLVNSVHSYLAKLKEQYPELNTLITDGVQIVKELSLRQLSVCQQSVSFKVNPFSFLAWSATR